LNNYFLIYIILKVAYKLCLKHTGAASSSDGDVDRYVIIKKLLDPIFNL
jgi:hypothetical protein